MSLTKVIAGMTDDSVFAANKNVIINGNFDIWQRGTSFSSVASSTYTADRWQWNESGAGVIDILQSTSVPDNTSNFSLQIDVTTADASIAAGDFYMLQYKIEGHDALRFAFGTADAKQLTLSFWVFSSKDGIHCVALRNAGTTRSYIVEYTVDAVNTWERKVITLTADTTGFWATDNTIGIVITWALAIGTTFHNTANTWNASNSFATSNQVNVLDSTANNFHLSQVQLEVSSVATEFEHRSFATELAMVQRYYTKSFPQGTTPAQNAGAIGSVQYRVPTAGVTTAGFYVFFPVTMRAIPALTYFNPSATNANWRNQNNGPGDSGTASDEDQSHAGFFIQNTQIIGDDVGERIIIHYTAEAEL